MHFSKVIALAWVISAFCQDSCIPNISTRVCPESSSVDVFAGLLVWTVREAGTDCWAEVVDITGAATINTLRAVRFGWDPGFRVGFGYAMLHDQWDTQIDYTRFHTKGSDRVSSFPGTVHSSFMGNFYVFNPFGLGISGPAYQAANVNWKIHFDVWDWELGRSFFVSDGLSLRPFFGAKWGLIDQTIETQWINPTVFGFFVQNVGTENLKNNFWGVGPQIGIHTNWRLFSSSEQVFSLFGLFSGALMWGHWSFKDFYNNSALSQSTNVALQDINSGATMVRTFMGFEWNKMFSRHQCYAKLGYEVQVWLDQLQYYSFIGGRLSNELTLQGGTLELALDF